MKLRQILPIIAMLALAFACAPKVKVNPAIGTVPPGPTLEDQARALAAAKIAGIGVSIGLGMRITALEKDAQGNIERIRILRAIKSFTDEFNAQLAPVVSIDITSRETVKRAVGRAISAAENLAKKDVLEVKDADTLAEINAAISGARAVFESFDTLFPGITPQ